MHGIQKACVLALATLGLSACVEAQQAATNAGVSPAVQQACMQAAAEEIAGIDEDMDFDAAMERLKAKGLACLIAAVQDVLTARIVAVTPTYAGEVVAANANAAAAIAE